MIIFFSSSCTKFGNGYAEGTVYEAVTNKPIKGATVKLYNSYHGGEPGLLGTTTTDDFGKYKINFYKKAGRAYGYIIRCNSPTQFYNTNYYDIDGKKTILNIPLNPFANMKLRIKNNSKNAEAIGVDIGYYNKTKGLTINSSVDTILSETFKINGNGRTPMG